MITKVEEMGVWENGALLLERKSQKWGTVGQQAALGAGDIE